MTFRRYFPVIAWTIRKLWEPSRPGESFVGLSTLIACCLFFTPLAVVPLFALGAVVAIDVALLPFRIGVDVWNGCRRRRAERTAARERKRNERLSREDAREQRERDRQDAETARSETARRSAARFTSQMHYDRLAAHIADRFSADRLQAYFDLYLSDGSSASDVELRAQQLCSMLDELAGTGSPGRNGNTSLASLREEYSARQAEIRSAGFDAETTAAMLASLSREEEQTIREFGCR